MGEIFNLILALYLFSHFIGLMFWFAYLASDCRKHVWPILFPTSIYGAIRVNWFGATCLYILYFISTPLFAIGTFVWWLCTVGRK